MKIRYDEGMKKNILMYGTLIILTVVVFFCFYNLSALKSFIGGFFSLISPFILGFAIAFLLNKPMMFFERRLLGNLSIKDKHKRTISALLAMVVGIGVVSIFFWLLIPQLLESIFSLVEAFPTYINDFQAFAMKFMEENEIDINQIQTMFGGVDILSKLTQIVTEALPEMVRMSYSVMSTLLNVLLGIMSALYMMLDKEKLVRHVRISVYAIFPNDTADYLRFTGRATADIFNNFIVGKAIDSLIIGILCYIGLTILQLPYAILLSVIVGVTNMIPVFGPFIGAVPGIIILLIIHPVYAIYFALFILLLQQFDGNILGPLILGDKLGLPSLWILFSVCVGGGLFGVVGMFIGVPLFTVFYMLARELFTYRLKKKNMKIADIDNIDITTDSE